MNIIHSESHKPRSALPRPIAEGTNRAFSHSIQTLAQPMAIWSLWSDPSTWHNWDLGLKNAKLQGAFVLGAAGRLTPKSGPTTTFTITAFEPGRTYTISAVLPQARLGITRTILADNPTVFEHRVTFKGPLAGLWAQFLGPGFRRELPPTMERIAEIAETGEAA